MEPALEPQCMDQSSGEANQPTEYLPAQYKTNYWNLPLELRAKIAQQVDQDTFIKIGQLDPNMMTIPANLKALIKALRFKKTFQKDQVKMCSDENRYINEVLATNPPPLYTQDDYLASQNYNEASLDKILSLAEEMCPLNTVIKGHLIHYLAMHIIEEFPPPPHKKSTVCTLCNSGQPVRVQFIYKGTGLHSSFHKVCSTDLDGWNLLTYIEVSMEFINLSVFPTSVEAFLPAVTYQWGVNKYPRLVGHDLIFKCVVSGMELNSIYTNIKKTKASMKDPTRFSPPGVHADTIIIYTLRGAQAFYSILEEENLLYMSFRQVIYDPRNELTPRDKKMTPVNVEWDLPFLTLYRTLYNAKPYPQDHPVSVRTVYHLMADGSWKIFKNYKKHGPSGRYIITQDLILPERPAKSSPISRFCLDCSQMHY